MVPRPHNSDLTSESDILSESSRSSSPALSSAVLCLQRAKQFNAFQVMGAEDYALRFTTLSNRYDTRTEPEVSS